MKLMLWKTPNRHTVPTWTRKCLALCLLVLLVAAGQTAYAGGDIEIREIVVFGDSLSDTGNVFLATTSNPDSPTIPGPQWFNGRFTNGPVWHEVLAESLDVLTAQPSLMGGTNYAWGGAEYGPGLALTGVPNVGAQIQDYLSRGGIPSDDQLFIVQAANNDLIPPGAPADPQVLADFAVEHISTLATAGARHFLVSSSLVNDTGKQPGLNPPLDQALFGPDGPADGVVEDILKRADRVNRLLRRELFRLERELKRKYREPVTITYVDLARVGRIISRRPAFFGIDDISTPALDAGPFPPTCFCGGFVAPDADRFFYFDIVHPTATVHEIYGKAALVKLKWKLFLASRRR